MVNGLEWPKDVCQKHEFDSNELAEESLPVSGIGRSFFFFFGTGTWSHAMKGVKSMSNLVSLCFFHIYSRMCCEDEWKDKNRGSGRNIASLLDRDGSSKPPTDCPDSPAPPQSLPQHPALHHAPAEACSFDPETQKLALVVVPRLENTTLGGPDGIEGGKIQA